MPHLIIEHSANISKNSVKLLGKGIQDKIDLLEGNFQADECRVRSFSFDEYLVGKSDQSTSSFIHISLKVLTGRSLEIRQNLAKEVAEFTHQFISNLNLPSQRCEISVDIIEMTRDTYQKIKIVK